MAGYLIPRLPSNGSSSWLRSPGEYLNLSSCPLLLPTQQGLIDYFFLCILPFYCLKVPAVDRVTTLLAGPTRIAPHAFLAATEGDTPHYVYAAWQSVAFLITCKNHELGKLATSVVDGLTAIDEGMHLSKYKNNEDAKRARMVRQLEPDEYHFKVLLRIVRIAESIFDVLLMFRLSTRQTAVVLGMQSLTCFYQAWLLNLSEDAEARPALPLAKSIQGLTNLYTCCWITRYWTLPN